MLKLILTYIFAFLLVFNTEASEPKHYIIVDGKKIEVKAENDDSYFGRFLPLLPKGEESGVYTVYIRQCGNITLHKNKSGNYPKKGELVKIRFKGRCAVDDWLPAD